MHGQDSSLHQGRLQVIVLHDDVFLQDLDGVDLVSPFPLRQHHLAERSSAQQPEKCEILSSDDIPALHIVRYKRVVAADLRLDCGLLLKQLLILESCFYLVLSEII